MPLIRGMLPATGQHIFATDLVQVNGYVQQIRYTFILFENTSKKWGNIANY